MSDKTVSANNITWLNALGIKSRKLLLRENIGVLSNSTAICLLLSYRTRLLVPVYDNNQKKITRPIAKSQLLRMLLGRVVKRLARSPFAVILTPVSHRAVHIANWLTSTPNNTSAQRKLNNETTRTVPEIVTTLVASIRPYRPRNKCKVIICAYDLRSGGAERQAALTAAGLQSLGYADILFASQELTRFQSRDFYQHYLEDAEVTLRQLPRAYSHGDIQAIPEELWPWLNGFSPALVRAIVSYAGFFRKEQPAVIHAWQDWMGVAAGLAAKLAGVPRIVISTRNQNPSRFSYYLPEFQRVMGILAKDPSVVFTSNSKAGARDYEEWLGLTSGRFQIIRNGFNFENLPKRNQAARSSLRQPYNWPKTARVVLGVLRLDAEKRPHLWLDAVESLVDRDPSVHAVLIGDGIMRQEVEKRVLDIGPRVQYIPRSRHIYEIMQGADLLLLTSSQEGTPNVLIEAAAVGLASVSLDAGGVGETMLDGVTGQLLPKESSIAAIEETLRQCLSSQKLAATAHRYGPDFVRRRFGYKRMVRETAAAYGLHPISE